MKSAVSSTIGLRITAGDFANATQTAAFASDTLLVRVHSYSLGSCSKLQDVRHPLRIMDTLPLLADGPRQENPNRRQKSLKVTKHLATVSFGKSEIQKTLATTLFGKMIEEKMHALDRKSVV